ncbi:MAG: hypothetical protein HQK56_20170 [Deltaproteobacteria bacterium]|nr:hypothetical protein [Deltaproteobacteria bacterium]
MVPPFFSPGLESRSFKQIKFDIPVHVRLFDKSNNRPLTSFAPARVANFSAHGVYLLVKQIIVDGTHLATNALGSDTVTIELGMAAPEGGGTIIETTIDWYNQGKDKNGQKVYELGLKVLKDGHKMKKQLKRLAASHQAEME